MKNTWDHVVDMYEGVINEIGIKKKQQELDKWFEELESKPQPSIYEQVRNESLDDKILRDFHGFAPTIDEKYAGKLPTITPKAQIYITETLKPGEYFRFGVKWRGLFRI